MLRRLRGRYGISASRVAVRTHIPWYWRGLAIIAFAGCSLALAGWMYDAGRRFAGFDSSASAQELAELRERSQSLQVELDGLRSEANASEAKLRIEQTTQEQLTEQVRRLERDNARLKEDIAAFENLALGEGKMGGLVLSRLRVEPATNPNEYHYHLLVALSGDQRSHEFNGILKFILVMQQGGKDVKMQIPAQNEASSSQYQVNVKHVRKLEGSFAVPAGSVIKSAEARLMQGGNLKATQKIEL